MLPITTRDKYRNFISGQGQTINLQGSLISKTNGININLVSVTIFDYDPLFTNTNPNNWPKKIKRTYSHLSPTYSLIETEVICVNKIVKKEVIEIVEYDYDVYLIEDKCKGTDLTFKNKYWVDIEGHIWKSVQWLSKDNIYATLTILQN